MEELSAAIYVGNNTHTPLSKQAFMEKLYAEITGTGWDGWIFYFGGGYNPLSVAAWSSDESSAESHVVEFLRNTGRGDEVGDSEDDEYSGEYEVFSKEIDEQDVLDYLTANMPVKSVEYRAKLQSVIDMLEELSAVTTGDEWDDLTKDIYNTAWDDFNKWQIDLCDRRVTSEIYYFIQDDLKDLYNLSLYENAEDENNLLPVIEATLPSVKKMVDRLISLMNRII